MLGILIVIFFLLKLPHLSIRFSDTSVYFYEGYKILHGAKMYKDILFTNLPTWGYVSAIYVFLTHNSVLLFFLTSKIEICLTAFLLFLIARKKTANKIAQIIAPTVYLFSLIILATSDHQTGVFFAVLCAVAAYYFRLINKPVLAGVCAALSFTTKAYTLPLTAALGIEYLSHERKQLIKFAVGFVVVCGAIVLPSLLIAPHEMYNQLIGYSLVRPAGLSKETIFSFFIFHDVLLFLLMIYSVLLAKKNTYVFLSVLFSVLFLFAYSDVYYLYLNVLVAAAAIAAAHLSHELITYNKKFVYILPAIVLLISAYNSVQYQTTFANIGTIPHINNLVETIKKEHPQVLYGADSIAPVLAYQSGVPLLDGIIDTNANFFNAGIYDAPTLTKHALSKRSIFVVPGISLPDQGIKDVPLSTIIDKDSMKDRCKTIQSIPFTSEGGENRILLIKCYK